MKIQKFCILIIVMSLLFSVGCGSNSAKTDDPPAAEEPSPADTPREEEPTDLEEPEAVEPEAPEEPEDTASDERTLARIHHAYADVLSGVRMGYVLPDGTSLEPDDYSAMETNQFAIADVDGDGRQELVLYFTGTFSAGMVCYVWEYDPETDDMKEELVEFPSLTFYENGLIQADASHNHSLGMDFWPYSLYQYEEASDTYTLVYEVSSWEKEFFPQDYNGGAFPDDIDTDGDGIVYLVADDSTNLNTTMDNGDFEIWKQEVFAGAQALDLPWEDLTYEAISYYMDPYMELIKNDIRDTATDQDLAYPYMTGGLDAIEAHLATDCGVTIEVDGEYEDYAIGTLNGAEVISFDYLNATSFDYTVAIDGVTVLGIAPGMAAPKAAEAILSLGFKPESDTEPWYATGAGMGNYSIYLGVENNVVTSISFRAYCRYAG